MKPLTKAIAVALIQVLIVCSLGAKLLYDRRTRPRAWFKAERYDPNLPIRGRYVAMQIEVRDSRSADEIEKKFGGEIQALENQRRQYNTAGRYDFGRECGAIAMRDGSPIAEFDESPRWDCDNLAFVRWQNSIPQGTRGGDVGPVAHETHLQLTEPLLFFIPDTAKDPSHLAKGEELWVLATIPRKGPPRPIALGVKKDSEKDIRPLGLD
jgi:hypothetical protein